MSHWEHIALEIEDKEDTQARLKGSFETLSALINGGGLDRQRNVDVANDCLSFIRQRTPGAN